jgi:hypothetical protein
MLLGAKARPIDRFSRLYNGNVRSGCRFRQTRSNDLTCGVGTNADEPNPNSNRK